MATDDGWRCIQGMTMPNLFSAFLCLSLTMAGLSSNARAADPSPDFSNPEAGWVL